MAFTVIPLLADIDLAESATPWSTGAVDPAFFVQGSNSIAFYIAKNVRGSITVTPASSVAWSAYSTPHIYFWMNSAVAGVTEAKSTGTTTASGYTVRVTLVGGAYREWHVTGSDTWDGGWEKPFCIDMSHTGTQLYASSGTWTNTANILSVTWYVDLSNSGNIRNVPANHWLDAIRVGDGLQAYNTASTDASFGFAEIAADDELVANKYGVMQNLNDVIMSQGAVYLGDSAGTNHLDFDSQDEVLVFADLDGSGDGLASADLYRIIVEANATAADQDFNIGVKVSTGANASGRNGTIIKAAGAMLWYFDSTDADLHNFTMYGATLTNAIGGTTYGVELDSPTTLFEVAGVTFNACEAVLLADAVATKLNFVNSTTDATSGALVWQDGETDIENCLFANNVNGVYIDTLTGDITLTGMTWSGNTYDIEYEYTADWDANWSDSAGAPSINNTSTGTLTAVNSVTLILTDVISGSQCSIYAGATGPETEGTELMNETAAGGDVTEPYAFSSDQSIRIRVRNASTSPKYFPYFQEGTIDSDGFTLAVAQIEDNISP